MRALRGLFCAVAITACLAPGARADEYTKQTFLTFSGPVQLPGITLPAGTYQFKLADPDTGRQTLQVWDKDGTKLYTTLLTIPDRRMTPTDKPTVMFTERASGEAQPIRAWFYPNETYGQEFVYPKEQAMKIARDTHSSVLAFKEDTKDASAYKSAPVGRVDENGKMTDADNGNMTADNANAAHNAPPASTTTASSASTTTAGSKPSSTTSSQTASAQGAEHNNMPAPSANRSGSPSTTAGTSGTTTSEANRDNMPNRAVGTTGSSASQNRTRANRTAQAGAGANAAAPRANQSSKSQTDNTAKNNRRELPHTAGSMMLVQLLAGLSLVAAFAVHLFRTRAAQVR